jgi:ubiquinone/menaquinone biosynthesis C-methylase UbiE
MVSAASRPSFPIGGPWEILEVTWGFGLTRIMVTAIELDVFTRISEGHETLEALARATNASSRGLRIVLNALAGMKLIDKTDGRYKLGPVAAAYLTKSSPHYLGGMVMHAEQLRPSWDRLTEIVRTGRPLHRVESNQDRGEFFAQFVGSLYALNAFAAASVARELWGENSQPGRSVLDIGAGSGVWGLAFARRDSQARVTVADWPVVIEKVTKNFVAREGAIERYDYLPGNFREVDFGEARFDVAILGQICHSEGAENTQRMLERLHRALKPAGSVVIADLLPDEARKEASFPLVFAVNMLVNTAEGDTFTFSEYREWLQRAGFGEVRTFDAPAPSPLILATKA